ncbi:MAG: GTP 3',8-cyclase MoaA [Polyangiaceae bacterium]|nr:GTP 3',8-cyclase MoaA [Polyangiaceae bacterium]
MGGQKIQDRFGRPLTDLRLSVTDRCNFRCRYCMPREAVDSGDFLKRSEILSYEEMVRLAGLFTELGVSKVRVTGGEPLLRKDLTYLLKELSGLGVDLALTTNGSLLQEQAMALRKAGLGRVTVSLDALDEELFQEISDAPGTSAQNVLAGIEASLSAGFESIKVNCVVKRGCNESQILPLVRAFSHRPVELRFIEYMEVGSRNDWSHESVFSAREILQVLQEVGPCVPIERRSPGETAIRYDLKRLGLQVGLISSVSQPFCGECSRARVSAEGRLYDCLFAHDSLDLKAILRSGATDRELMAVISEFWSRRTARFSENARRAAAGIESFDGSASARATQGQFVSVDRLRRRRGRVEMSRIGG